MDLGKGSARFWASLFLSLLSLSAPAAVIDFDNDGLLPGSIINTQYSGIDGLTISAENFNNSLDLAVIFDSNNVTGGDRDLGAPFYRGEEIANPGNILIIQEHGPCSDTVCEEPDDEGKRAAGMFFLEFDAAVILESIDFFDIEEPESMGSIKLYNPDGELLPDMFAVPDTGGDNTWDQVVFDVGNVKRVEILMGGSGAIDNIAYSAVPAVPVPPAAWLFASGLGLLAGLRRRWRVEDACQDAR